MDTEQVAMGAFLIAVSCVVLAQTAGAAVRTPISVVALGAVGLAIGSLLVDTVTA